MKTVKTIEIVRKEIDATHYYFVDGVWYPGVTSILDEAAPKGYGLLNFFKNNDAESIEKIKEETAEFGSKMHDAYEKLLNGVELNLAKDYPTTKEKKHIISFYTWYNATKPTEIQTEHTIASVKYRFAGTLDLACKINGETWIIDFKTSSGIYMSHEMQITAYKQAFEEMYGVKVAHLGIVRTGTKHKAGYEFKEVTRELKEFLNVYEMYKSLHGGKIPDPPLVDVYPETLKLDL